MIGNIFEADFVLLSVIPVSVVKLYSALYIHLIGLLPTHPSLTECMNYCSFRKLLASKLLHQRRHEFSVIFIGGNSFCFKQIVPYMWVEW